MTDPNGADREFDRVSAAAFLTEQGFTMAPQRLATRASEGRGPPFEKRGRHVVYKESALRAWLVSGEAGRKRGAAKPGPQARNAKERRALPTKVGLEDILREHIALAERFADGTADGQTGYRFAQSLDRLRKMVS